MVAQYRIINSYTIKKPPLKKETGYISAVPLLLAIRYIVHLIPWLTLCPVTLADGWY